MTAEKMGDSNEDFDEENHSGKDHGSFEEVY